MLQDINEISDGKYTAYMIWSVSAVVTARAVIAAVNRWEIQF